MSSFISRFGGDMSTRQSGKASIDRALNSGMTINEVRNLASREGVSFGPAAQSFLNSQSSSNFISQYGGDYSSNASGLASVNRAEAAGMSWEDIQRQGQQQGISWGSKAQDYFSSKAAEKIQLEEERKKAEKKAEFDRLNSFQQENDSIQSPDSIYRTPEADEKSWIKRDYGKDNTPDYEGMTMKTPADAKKSTTIPQLSKGEDYSNAYLQSKTERFKSGYKRSDNQFGLNLRGGSRMTKADSSSESKNSPWLKVREMREDRRKGYGEDNNSFDRRS